MAIKINKKKVLGYIGLPRKKQTISTQNIFSKHNWNNTMSTQMNTIESLFVFTITFLYKMHLKVYNILNSLEQQYKSK